MTRLINSLQDVLSDFDVAVLDQWGVVHDGTTPYPHAIEATEMLADHGKEMVVVSNSGKRSTLNRERMQRIGLPMNHIGKVVTSGEALWDDILSGRITVRGAVPNRLFPICAKFQDAIDWSSGCDQIELRDQLDASVDAIFADDQDDVATNELPTESYTLLNASLSYTFADSGLLLFLRGSNLLDEDIRQHTSPLKDLVPLPGRSVHFGLRYEF